MLPPLSLVCCLQLIFFSIFEERKTWDWWMPMSPMFLMWMRLGLSNGWWMEFTSIKLGLPIHFYIGTYSQPHLSYHENFIGNEAGLIWKSWWMKYAIKLRTSHHFSMTAYLIPHNSKTYNSYLVYFKYYIHKNLGLDNLDGFCSNFLSLIFLSLICHFLSPCGHWKQLGDRMETEWRQKGDKKMSMISHEGFIGETLLTMVFVQSMNISALDMHKMLTAFLSMSCHWFLKKIFFIMTPCMPVHHQPSSKSLSGHFSRSSSPTSQPASILCVQVVWQVPPRL